ncbi:DUF4221 family protein [Roseivirga sp. E12]|uniref:DUF4221 family protein n=1 Tax=Roseivirga sp. E12 TaxID=2819237 RepID=UPI001ABC4BDC|nr:DUF4221 family protein [Roseivirga sp. E12]MBO3698861.1 DUF4221 family protein [Roseivirga sp. E12]
MNKHIKGISASLLLILLAVSCGGSAEKSENEHQVQDYITYVADSLSFDYLPEVLLMDYSEETEELILIDRKSREVLIIDNQGAIVSKFNPHIEGPGYVGNFDHGWIFHGENLVCFSNYYFYEITKEGEYIARHKYPVEVNGIWSLDYLPEMSISYKSPEGDPMFLAFITEPAGHNYNTQAFQDSAHMLHRMDLQKGTSEPIMKKRPESIYRNLGAYVDRGWPYFRQVDNNLVVVTYSIDDKFYLYDANTDELVQTFEIPEEFKPKFETVPFGSKEKPDKLRINIKVMSDGKHIFLRVLSTIPESVEKVLRRNENWRQSQAYRDALKKYSDLNTLVYNLDGTYLGPLENGAGLVNYDMESTSDGFYWVQRRYNDERPYRTFLKIKVKTKE